MRVLVISALAWLALSTAVSGRAAETAAQAQSPPSEESVRHLLEVTQAKKILETLSTQMDTTFDAMLQKQLQGENLSATQKKSLETRRKAAEGMIKELLSWESMERLYLKVYRDSFTQAEVDGMAAFYASPAGQAVIAKLPLVVKNTMTEMQLRMQQMVPKLQQMAKEAAEEVKAQEAAKTAG